MKKIILDEANKIEVTEDNAQKINIDYATLKNYPSWYKLENDYFYFKKADLTEIKNHLLGAKIANYFYLKAPHFLVATQNGNLGLLSQNFRQKNVAYDYFDYEISEFFFNSPSEVISIYKKFFEIKSLFRLIALQIAINLEDLTANNILLRKLNNKVVLDFIYDFDYAFTKLEDRESAWYESAIIDFEIPSNKFYELCENYPYFKKQLLRILNLDVSKYIKAIESEYEIYYDIDYYREQCMEIKDLIRSLKL